MKEYYGLGLALSLLVVAQSPVFATSDADKISISEAAAQKLEVKDVDTKVITSDSIPTVEKRGAVYWDLGKVVKAFGLTTSHNDLSTYVNYNGKKVEVCSLSILGIDGTIYVPTSFFVEHLNCAVKEENGKLTLWQTAESERPMQFLNKTLYKVGKEVNIDFNGEKKSVNVIFTEAEDGFGPVTLTVGDASYTEDYCYPTNYWAVLDCKGTKVIAISEQGMSSDYFTHLYQYDSKSNKIKSLGMIGGLVSGGMVRKDGLVINSEGIITTEERMDVVHTGWFDKQYQIKNGKVEPVANQGLYPTETEVTLLSSFNFYTAMSQSSPTVAYPKGTKMIFTATDNDKWIEFTCEDGKKVYATLIYPNAEYHYTESIVDAKTKKPIESSALFEGLLFAD